jgi:hypothetical protein
MPGMIKDGTGKGFLAKVDDKNRLFTRAINVPIRASKAGMGQAFVISLDRVPITATKGLVGWLYNSDDSRYLAIPQISISWNGGDTNHNRVLEVDFAGGDGQPTTNTKAVVSRNTKGGDPTALPAVALQWNGVGTGMTGHDVTQHVDISFIAVAQGHTVVETEGAFLVSPKTSISLYARGEELGSSSVSVWSYILDPALDEME